MNIQIYFSKRNFDVQKAERYFKERRIPVQLMDLKKHRLGEREVRSFLSAIGAEKLLARDDNRVKEHPACYDAREETLIPAIMECPWLLVSPIVRSGQKITAGYQPDVWKEWE